MTPEQWSTIRNFKPSENWGDPSRMSYELLQALDDFRDAAGTPILVTCGTQGSHVGESQHFLGKAADIVFPNLLLPRLFDMLILASRFPALKGIGIYPHWKVAGVTHGGLHLDVRDARTRSYWMGVPDGPSQKYVPLTAANLVTYGLIEKA